MQEYGDEGFDSKVSRYPGVSFRQWTKYGFGWCFGQLATNDITPLQADPDIYILPDGVMDMSVGSIPVATRTTMRTRLEASGLSFTDVKTTWTVRQLLTYIARQIQPDINVEAGDVRDDG